MSEFEEWFKTTSAYRMLEVMNYYKMDLFHWVVGRGEYRHSSVQIAFMTWVEQQSEIDELKAEKAGLGERIDLTLALIDTTSYSEITRRMPDFIDQIKESLRGGHETS